MNIQTLISFLAATAIIVVIPGPNILLITNDSIRYGFKKGVLTTAGVSAGMILLFSFSLAGVSSLLVRLPWLFETLKLAGAFYLSYIGVIQIRDSLKPDPQTLVVPPVKKKFFISGFLMSATNPKGLFFAGAFFPQFINNDTALLPQVVFLCGGCLFVSSLIGMGYAFFAETAMVFLNSEKCIRRATFFSGLVLIVFGIGLLFTHHNGLI